MGRKKGVSHNHDEYVLLHTILARVDNDAYETMVDMIKEFEYKNISEYIREALDDKNRANLKRLYGD